MSTSQPDSERQRDRVIEFAVNASREVRVKAVGATNFRAFREVTLEPGQLTAIVGANAAGKSSVVDLFRFVSDSLRLSLYTALERRGGLTAVRHSSPTRPRNCKIWIELEFGGGYTASYAFHLKSGASGSYSVAEEDCRVALAGETLVRLHLKEGRVVRNSSALLLRHRFEDDGLPVVESNALALPLLGTFELSPVLTALRDLRLYSIVPDKLRDLQDPDEGTELLSDGSNAASVLRHLEPSDKAELVEMLGHVVPGVEAVETVSHGNKLTLEFKQRASRGRNTFEALQMSDGTLRLVGLLLALYQRDRPAFMAVEEPEATIHVAALHSLIEIFKARADVTQIVLTTHSADILDAIDAESIFLVSADQGASRLAKLAPSSKRAVEEALFTAGELLRSGALEAAVEDPC